MNREPATDLSDPYEMMTKEISQRNALRRFWDMFRREHKHRLKQAGIIWADSVNDMEVIGADIEPEVLARTEAEEKRVLSVTPSTPSRSQETRPRPRRRQATQIPDKNLTIKVWLIPYQLLQHHTTLDAPKTEVSTPVQRSRLNGVPLR